MVTDGADDLVTFSNVRVIESTAADLFCRIGARCVWLPRRHVSGNLRCAGDRGKLLIRRWIARDRHLIEKPRAAIPAPLSIARSRRRVRLHLVRPAQGVNHGN
jgi:hypothetical protein